jgi:poly-beta-1,6-N-acetyl-D-glucosamine synthase
VLAVRNGSEYIERRLENLLQQEYPADRLEILVVCNACSDGTAEQAASIAHHDPRVRVLESPADQGKAGALNLGVSRARGDFIVFADVRQRFLPRTIRCLVDSFADPKVGAVSGRLIVERGESTVVEGTRLYWGLETKLRLAESGTGSVMGATGAIYAVRRRCFEPIPARTILDDVWLPMRILLRGNRVILDPLAVAVDVPAENARHEYLRKRRTIVGNLQLLRSMPELLNPVRNPAFVRFVSHKVLRLGTPFFLLGIVGSAALLPGAFYQAVFVAGLAAYALGCLGLVLRAPILAVPATVLLMHAVVFSAFRHFREDAGSVWRPSALGSDGDRVVPVNISMGQG